MLRTALRPRFLGLLVVVLVLAGGMAALGQWQLDRARQQGVTARRAQQLAAPVVPLDALLTARRTFPDRAADRRVTATGTWDGARQLFVAGRLNHGTAGLWVLTPLRLGDGSAVAVVRGWVPTAADPAASPAALPTGPVDLSGVLRPADLPIERAPGEGTGLPADQLDGVDVTQLVQRWPYPLLTGYLVQDTARPAAVGPAPAPVSGDPPGGLAWQNLSYALQWFTFAGFGVFLWWRMVRDEHRGLDPRPPALAASARGVTIQ